MATADVEPTERAGASDGARAALAGRLLDSGRADLLPLFASAGRAAARAYVPYSRFRVGVMVATGSGRTFWACNVENASYPIGVCAERVALAAAVVGPQEHRLTDVEQLSGRERQVAAFAAKHDPRWDAADARPLELALVAFGGDGAQAPCSPCGACRQAIVELNPACQVHFFVGEPLALVSTAASELLPAAFQL